jgi:hypothetical protein
MPEQNRGDFLDLLRRSNPRSRRTVVRVIEGKADQDGAAFVQEQLSMVEADLTVRQVDFISSRTCSCGHLQDQQTRLTAVCEPCGAVTCSTPGCSFTCSRCGKALCRRHAHVSGEDEVYCSGCWVWALLRRAIMGKRR